MHLEITRVNKHFGKTPILTDITLTAVAGEILCLLGPSGAGKTTLIRLITGAIAADSGEIRMDGQRCPNRAVLSTIGYMPQNDAVYTDLSGYDNLRFFGGLYGLHGKRLQERSRAALELVDLLPDQNKIVSQYSSGMRKRLSLAIAAMHQPQLLVLDEPTVGIDPVLRKTIWNEFEAWRAAGCTLIVSTHVMDEAMRCQRAALLYQGRVIQNDTIAALVAKTSSGSLEELFFLAEQEKRS